MFEPKPEVSELGLVHEVPTSEAKALETAKLRALSDLDFCGYLDEELREAILACPVISEVDRLKAVRFRDRYVEVAACG